MLNVIEVSRLGLHTTLKAWRIADNSISFAGTVVDFLFKVQDKILY
jgi:hypothetical protein